MKTSDPAALLAVLSMLVATMLGGVTIGGLVWFGDPLSFEVMR